MERAALYMTTFIDLFFNPLFLAALCGFTCGIIGPFFVWRKLSFLGDAIAHSAMTPLSVSLILGVPPIVLVLPFNILFGLFLAFLYLRKAEQLDSTIAVFFAGFMGVGLLISSFTGVGDEEILHFLFGNITSPDQIISLITIVVAIATIAHILFWQKDLLLMVLQKDLAKIEGVRVNWHEVWLLVIMALVVTVTLKLMGTILLTSLLITPPVVIRHLSGNLKTQLLGSAVLGTILATGGVSLALAFNIPASGSVAGLSLLVFLATSLFFKPSLQTIS